ncbi:uncharacterized protein [Hetaerina americana]|uniref:uncharacterized protein n=1 Tax=Hetaerina americana TaxID=62018 RepID=UPI003A7F3A33
MLRSLMKFTGRPDVRLLDGLEAKRATTGVEGFTSVVLRVSVPYCFDGDKETYRHTFLVKRLPFDEFQLGLVNPPKFFEREGIYFEKLVPGMLEVSGGIIPVPFPICYGTEYNGVDDAIVMQDLGEDRYRTPNRRFQSTGLDLLHCNVAIEALGRLHALSIAAEGAVLSPSTGSWVETFPLYARDALWFEAGPGEPRPFFTDYVKSMISTILMIAKEMDGVTEDPGTFDALERALNNVVPILCRLVKPNEDGRNVVTHGDCWMNNMMFRYERDARGDEIPVDAKFIDFQITRYCHPCIDLLYFLYTSTSKALRGKYLDKMISNYYTSMAESLRTIGRGLPPMSLEEFREDFFGPYMPYGVIIRTLFYPMLLLGEDFAPSDAERFSPEKCEEFVKTGNAPVILSRFKSDAKFRLEIEELVRDFVDVAMSGVFSAFFKMQYVSPTCGITRYKFHYHAALEYACLEQRRGVWLWLGSEKGLDIEDREHLHRALVNFTGRTDVEISGDAQVNRATIGFEGYLSVVLRVTVSFTTEDDPTIRTKSLFVKCLPKEKYQLDMVKWSNVFERETLYYGKVFPLMKQAAAGKLSIPIPQCYHTFNDGINDVIFLENLLEAGFSTVGLQYMSNGFDWEHTSMLVKALGVLNALTIAAERLLPGGMRSWVEAFPALGKEAVYYVPKPGEPPVPFKGVADTGNEIVVEIARQMPGLPKLAAESGKLRSILQAFWPIISELVKSNSKGHNVLSHGDCWANNFMFQYKFDDKGTKVPVSIKVVDFQLVRYCHPSIDLLYFMHRCLSKDFRKEHYDKVIIEYYNSLRDSLKTLRFGPPPFSLEEFMSDTKEVYKPFAVYLTAVYTPCALLGEDVAPKNVEDMTPELFEEIVTSGNVSAIRKRLYSDPLYRSKVEIPVREFVDLIFPKGTVETSPFSK